MQNNATKFLIGAAAVLVVGAVLVMSGHSATTGSKPIVIGSVLGLTGDAAVDSLNIQRGMELARADLAKQGITVDIKYEDDETDSTKTVLATQRLISLYQPQAFVGFTWDFLLDAASPIIISAKVPTYSPGNTPETSSSRSPYIFFGTSLNTTKLQPTADFLEQNHSKRVAIVIQKSAWGLEMIDIYKQAAALAGASVVMVDQSDYGQEASVFPTVAAEIKQDGADTLLWSGAEASVDVLLPKLEQLGVDIPVIGDVGIEDSVRNGHVVKTMTSPWLVYKTNISQAFAQKFEAAYGSAPGVYSDFAYDGLMVMVEAIRNTDGSPDQVAAYLRDGKVTYHGYGASSFIFSPDGGLKGGVWSLVPIQTK
jgi:branched-chain amino acid transport system substrate-binding protein